MSMKQKFLLALVLLSLTFGGGMCIGYRMDRGDVDPQDYIQTVFTPYESGIDNYLAMLDRAKRSVFIADYAFTDPRIADKLIELKTKRNVEIRILLDKSQTEGRTGDLEKKLIARMRACGIEVLCGTSEVKHALLHCKYTIVDELWTESGSWNYTKAANDQNNTLDFIKSKKRARLFRDNWERMHRYVKTQQNPAPSKGSATGRKS